MSFPYVLIDATAVPRDRGGVGRYVDNIVAALVQAEVDMVVVCQVRDRKTFESFGASTVTAPRIIERAAFRFIWEQFGLPLLVHRIRPDVIHSPHYTFPLWSGVPRVVTIHDLTFFTMPKLHSRMKGIFFRWWIRAINRKKIAVLADSEATARDYVEIVGASEGTITVSHLGYDKTIFHPPDPAAIHDLAAVIPDLPETWIAFLGTLEPRKNVAALIEGYCEAMHGKSANVPALLLAGGSGWDDEVQPAIERARAAGLDVRKLGYLPIETLSAFLGLSILFAYPSLGEGFGLPVLEAMATGACVLTTNRLSLPEVGGDAVAYTGVTSGEIGEAVRDLLSNDSRRNALSAAGIARAALFSWDRAATRHRECYVKAAEHG